MLNSLERVGVDLLRNRMREFGYNLRDVSDEVVALAAVRFVKRLPLSRSIKSPTTDLVASSR